MTGRQGSSLEAVTACLLLALASVDIVGYGFGGSHHGLVVPVLKRLMDRTLYPGDVMVATAERVPTLCYRVLAALVPGKEAIPAAFFALYVLAVAAILAGAYRIGRWIGGPAVGAATLLIAFPARGGLAGDALPRLAFSHWLLAVAVGVWALVFFLEGRRLVPLLLLSFGAHNDLFYSAYLLVGLLLVVLAERRRTGARRTLVLLASALLPLVPLAVWMSSHLAPTTAEGIAMLRLHVFAGAAPDAFGSDLTIAASLLALACLALWRLPPDKRALVALLLAGTALQLVIGSVFTVLVPVRAVVEYRPYRSWCFLVLLLYGLVAASIVEGWREGGLARAAALVTALLLLPGLEPLLPVALFLQAVVGRPATATWARILAGAVLVAVGALSQRSMDWSPAMSLAALTGPSLPAVAAVGLLLVVGRGSAPRRRRLLAAAAAAGTLLWLAPTVYARVRPTWERGAWRDIQSWVRLHTPKSAVLLTPPQEAGFRVFSERAVVGESADPGQPCFDDAIVLEWAGRMDLLEGDRYPKLSDERLLAIARQFGASHIVMPGRRERRLREAYRNTGYVVYEAGVGARVPEDAPVRRGGAR